MVSPLVKRIPREIRAGFGKYLGIFLMMVLAIGTVTGFLAAAKSIQSIMDGMYDAYAVEDARFTTHYQLARGVIGDLEGLDADDADKIACTVHENFSFDVAARLHGCGEAQGASDGEATLRLWSTGERAEVDKPAYACGRAPQNAHEIALDRVFCANNGLELGDSVSFAGSSYAVVGILTLPDMQALFQDNGDFVFNALSFGVGLVDGQAFAALEGAGLAPSYTYSVTFAERGLSQSQRTHQEWRLQRILSDADVEVSEFLDSSANQGIGYAADDVAGDQMMWIVLMCLLILIMGFVFVVLNNAYIEEESAVIGTLMSLGASNAELTRHYMAVPVVVGLAAAVAGNVVGYVALAGPMAQLYYGSYSLPPYVASFHPDVFVFATVVPLALLWAVSWWGLRRKMGHTALQFLRHDIGRQKGAHQVRLPHAMGFIPRFGIRLFLRNLSNYVTLFAGIVFASLLLVFGLCMMPTIDSYVAHMKDDLVAEHTYTLSEPLELEGTASQREAYAAKHELDVAAPGTLSSARKAELEDKSRGIKKLDNAVNTQVNSKAAVAQAEKFAAASFKVTRLFGGSEDVTVYGIQPDSAYWSGLDVSGKSVLVGRGLAAKGCASTGQTVSLKNEFTGWTYGLRVTGECGSTSCTNVYMSIDYFNKFFKNDSDYFNGYVSNEELALDPWVLESDMTPASMESVSEQMENSMSDVLGMFLGLAGAIYLILMYLLTKNAIDGSARCISYMKVFGYRDREINRLFLASITITVVVSLVVSLPVVAALLTGLLKLVFMGYAGNIEACIPLSSMGEALAVGLAAYAIVALLHVRRIKRVPMALALKVLE